MLYYPVGKKIYCIGEPHEAIRIFFAAIKLLEESLARHIDAFWPPNQITYKLERTLGSLGAFNIFFSLHPEHWRQ